MLDDNIANSNPRTDRNLTQPNNLKITHWNCCGLYSKIEQLQLFINTNSPDIICLNELKSTSAQANYILSEFTDRYNCIYKCRTPKRLNHQRVGGGVAILINKNLEYNRLTIPTQYASVEIVGIELTLERKNLVIYATYNPPQHTLNSNLLKQLLSNNSNTIVIGDLNARSKALGCSGTNRNGRELFTFLSNSTAVAINQNLPRHIIKPNWITARRLTGSSQQDP